MKKAVLVLLVCLISALPVLSQTSGQIEIVKKHFYLNDKKLSNSELNTLLKSQPESASMFKKSKTNTTIGTVLAGAGTVLVLYAVLNPPEEDGILPGLISDEEMNRHLKPLLIGGGIVLAGVPFLVSGSKQFKKSITIYNSKHATGLNSSIKLDFGLTRNGVGITCNF